MQTNNMVFNNLKIGLFFVTMMGVVGCVPPSGSKSEVTSNSEVTSGSSAGDEAAKRELNNVSWVKDVFISPGHMNIGVLRGEKDWTASMIGKFACAILKNNKSGLRYVRFVDIEEVAYQNKSPNEAEIYKVTCP